MPSLPCRWWDQAYGPTRRNESNKAKNRKKEITRKIRKIDNAGNGTRIGSSASNNNSRTGIRGRTGISGKTAAHNEALLRDLETLVATGRPILVGASRKSFLGRLTGAGVNGRLAGSLAALIPAVGLERVVVRVHDPEPTRHFLEVACRLREAAT